MYLCCNQCLCTILLSCFNLDKVKMINTNEWFKMLEGIKELQNDIEIKSARMSICVQQEALELIIRTGHLYLRRDYFSLMMHECRTCEFFYFLLR